MPLHTTSDGRDTLAAIESLRMFGALDRVNVGKWDFRAALFRDKTRVHWEQIEAAALERKARR